MIYSISQALRTAVHKGEIRNTVLRQVKSLRNTLDLLDQCISIKSQEIEEYKEKDPGKVKKLRHQVSIMSGGKKPIQHAIDILQGYKNTKRTSKAGNFY